MKRVKTGGRRKGVPNKATAAKTAEIAASGLTPLDFLLNVMRNDAELPDRRLEAAKSAAPYVHPRLHATEHNAGKGVDTLSELLKSMGNSALPVVHNPPRYR